MEQAVKEFWDKRFAEPGYSYGTEPNVFFKSTIDSLHPGRIFIPGAGEGRDVVYAATKGWEVYCADLSEAGKMKALKLAAENNVRIQYDVKSIDDVQYAEDYFDVVASIYFHLPEKTRKSFCSHSIKWLKPGGLFISELFTPQQLQNTSGGPKDVALLVTAEQMAKDLQELEIIKNEETEVILNEGKYHRGKANVVRFIGKKKQEK